MDADKTLERLVRLGDELSELGGEEKDLADVVREVTEQAKSRAESVLDELDDDDLDTAMERLERAQEQVRGDKALRELSDEELTNFSQLGNLRQVLSARRVRLAADEDFLKWFAEDAWPVLKASAPVVLALL